MINDALLVAAERLGVPVSPRDRFDIAQDTLERVMQIDEQTELALDGETGIWRARCGTWTFMGAFDETVALLALHVAADERHEVPREDPTGWAASTH